MLYAEDRAGYVSAFGIASPLSFDSLRKVFAYASTLLVHRRTQRSVPLPITDDQAHAENYACADKSNLAFFRQTSNGGPVTHH